MKKLVLLFACVATFLAFSGLNIQAAENDYNVEIVVDAEKTDSTTLKYLINASEATNKSEMMRNYKLASANLSSKSNISKDDVNLLAAIYIKSGDLATENNNTKQAFNLYSLAYNNLKLFNLNENSQIALAALTKIFQLAKETNNERYYKDSLTLIETKQNKLLEKYPYYYSVLSEYYEKNGDTTKSKYYKNKVSKYKTDEKAHIIFKNEKILVTDKNAVEYVQKVLNEEDFEEKDKALKEAVKYYYDKEKKDGNLSQSDTKVLACLLIVKAEEEKGLANFEGAIKFYNTAYHYMKKENIHKNSEMAFHSLYCIYSFSKIFEDKEFYNYALLEIEQNELKFADKEIYSDLYEYYKEKEDIKKANYYKKKLKN